MRYQAIYGKELEQILTKAAQNKQLHLEFLFDLLSPTEFKELAVRWQIIKQLNKHIPHRQIAKNLGVSVATVTRGSRELLNNKGGFKLILTKLK